MANFSKLKRQQYPMPEEIKQVLPRQGAMELYRERPPYQQNDYIGWITRAKRETAKQKQLSQMLIELKQGDCYMNMKWKPKLK